MRPQYQRPKLAGWRFAAFLGAIVGGIGAFVYPIVVLPYQNPDEWQSDNAENRKIMNIKPEDSQPANMKIWTDPFDRQDKPGKK